MKYFFLIFGLVVFSMVGTSFAIPTTYNSENECDIDNDLKRYNEILKDDAVIKTFLEKYPFATSSTSGTIDESAQSQKIYRYETLKSSVQLNVNVFEIKKAHSPCLYPSQYTLNYRDDINTIHITNYFTETRELLDFLNSKQNKSSEMNYFWNADFQLYVIKHKQYEYFIPYHMIGGKISDVKIDCDVLGILIQLQDAKESMAINIPRKLIDAKTQGQDVDFIIFVDGKEADFEEVKSDRDSRTLQISLFPSSKIVEILASNVGQLPEPGLCGMADADSSQYFLLLPPLQQFKSGIPVEQIQCKEGFVLLLHPVVETPSCVKAQTEQKLVQRGWYYPVPFGKDIAEPKTDSNIERFLIQHKIEYIPSKLVITHGITTGGDPACGAVMDVDYQTHWFTIDSISKPQEIILYPENPHPCMVNTSSCFCNAQKELAALTLEKLSYFTPEEEEKYANILLEFIENDPTMVNIEPKFRLGKLNLNFTDPDAVGYCGERPGDNKNDFFSGAVVDGRIHDYGLDRELSPLCAISEPEKWLE
ncbi:MAG: hypothetical protein HZA82_01720 [Thaumarchaeota archaeon]|nr:hypothetical protein [Nitrososphaerota archaeon]